MRVMRLRGLCALITAICIVPWHVEAKTATPVSPVLVAFTQNSNVFLINLATRHRTVVTTKGRDNGSGASYPWYAWSPDGKYLALLRRNNGPGATAPQNLLVLDRSGTVLHTLVGGSGDFYPGWAVDTDQVAYISDSGYDHGRAYFDVTAVDMQGRTSHLWRSTNAQFCGIGEGVSDPAGSLYLRESNPERSLRWSARSGIAVYASPCAPGLQVINLPTGKTSVFGAARSWRSPALSRTGVLALVGQSAGAGSVPSVQLLRARTGAILASVGPGEAPSWSTDGKSLYFEQRTVQTTVEIGHGTATLTSTRYLASICRATSDGSGRSVVVQLSAYYLGGFSQVPGSRVVIFSVVGNDSRLTTLLKPADSLDATSRRLNQPHVNIEQVDGSGRVTVLVPNAGLPAVQPVAVT